MPSRTPTKMRAFALLREVSASYDRCLRERAEVAIDVALARAQHRAYADCLRALGVEVEVLPPLDGAPDAVFVEDAAVLLDRAALVTVPGAASRREETAGIGEALARRGLEVATMSLPATLDGGDVLRWERTLFVGLSSRTNEAGARRLADLARAEGIDTVTLRVGAGLHLKSACSLLDGRTLVFDPARLDPAPMRARGLACVAAPEAPGANLLHVAGAVVISAAAPRTAEAARARGLAVRVVDVGELHKGDGALTCLSLRSFA